LEHEGLPDLEVWPAQFANIANGTHIFRGVEVTLEGLLQIQEGNTLVMSGNDKRPPLLLEPIETVDKIQWDAAKASVRPLDPIEQDAYSRLQQTTKNSSGSLNAIVTGPLKKTDHGYILEVREFSVAEARLKT